MKDKEARERLDLLEARVRINEMKFDEITLTVVLTCPKCKHDTPQWAEGAHGMQLADGSYSWLEGGWRCLVCGSLIEHSTEETHKLIKE